MHLDNLEHLLLLSPLRISVHLSFALGGMHEEDLISFQEWKLTPKFHHSRIDRRLELISKRTNKKVKNIRKYSKMKNKIGSYIQVFYFVYYTLDRKKVFQMFSHFDTQFSTHIEFN